MNQKFITMTNSSYLGLANYLAETIKRFSTRELIIVTIPDDDWHQSCMRKLDVLQSVGSGDFVWIDADSVAMWNVDKIWDCFHSIPEYPLLQNHANNPDKNHHHIIDLGVQPSLIPGLHACLIAFQEKHRSFFQDCRSWKEIFEQRGWYYTDETFINIQLNKIGALQHLPIMADSPMVFDKWLEEIDRSRKVDDGWHLFCHGEKGLMEAERRVHKLFKTYSKLEWKQALENASCAVLADSLEAI